MIVFVGESLGFFMYVFGIEIYMIVIVGMVLGKREILKEVGFDLNVVASMFFIV